MPSVPLCQHIKTNGKPCGAPALNRRRFWYFHDESRKRRRASAKRAKAFVTRHNALNMPILEDANAVQVGLMETINALIDARITEHQCGLILYALQTASANLKRATFETDAPKPAEPWVEEMLTYLRAIPDPPEPERKSNFGPVKILHAHPEPWTPSSGQSSSTPSASSAPALSPCDGTIPRIRAVAEQAEQDEELVIPSGAATAFSASHLTRPRRSRGTCISSPCNGSLDAGTSNKPRAVHLRHVVDSTGRSIFNAKIVNPATLLNLLKSQPNLYTDPFLS